VFTLFVSVISAYYIWLPRAVDYRVSCSQIPRCAFAGIRAHGPLVESSTSKPIGHDAPSLDMSNRKINLHLSRCELLNIPTETTRRLPTPSLPSPPGVHLRSNHESVNTQVALTRAPDLQRTGSDFDGNGIPDQVQTKQLLHKQELDKHFLLC
jgi:hypothetical protein